MLTVKKLPKIESGFTVIELLIASAVFSVVLLVALTGFLQIGRIFYKGVSDTQTQTVTRQVVTDVSSSLANTSTDYAITGINTYGGYRYMCVGIIRYTWGVYQGNSETSLNNKPTFYDFGQPKTNYGSIPSQNYNPYSQNPSLGLLRDAMPAEGGCPVPCIEGASDSAKCPDSNFVALNKNNPKEMLGDQMRIADLSVTKTQTGLYDVSVIIAYGSNDLIEYKDNNVKLPSCIGNSGDQRFCAVQQLQTSAQRGGRSI